MKKLNILLLVMLSFSVVQAKNTTIMLPDPSKSLPMPEIGVGGFDEVLLDSEHIFVPKGFDSNDASQVVLTGWLPSPCYQRPHASAQQVGDDVYISLKATKSKVGGNMCILMAVPYTVPVDLGRLAEGEYRLHVNQATLTPMKARLGVVPASKEKVDDYTYASVDMVAVFEDTREVSLSGINPSDCVELDTVKIFSNDKDVYAVLPIMKQVRENCKRKPVPFNYVVDLPNDLDAERVLLHVRSLDGEAVNKVFDNY